MAAAGGSPSAPAIVPRSSLVWDLRPIRLPLCGALGGCSSNDTTHSDGLYDGVSPRGLEVVPIGVVESSLTDPASAPKQGDEGAPDAWLVFEPAMFEALDDICAGDELMVLTWLDRALRDVLRVHPRGDTSRARQGVFSTRSPHRPNPIGLHRVEVASRDGCRVRVHNLEAVNGTPIVDVKPVLSSDIRER